MRAIICNKYGTSNDLIIKKINQPDLKNDEVCIEVSYSSVTESDILMRGGLLNLPYKYQIPMRLMFGLIKPRQPILGFVLSGEIVQIGSRVTKFKEGDKVYGLTGFSKGAYAEYKCMKQTDSLKGCLALKPKNISFKESTIAIYGGMLALQFMNKWNVSSVDKILIYGASGNCGIMATQIAKSLGATVHGVCSEKNRQLIELLGAEMIFDYNKIDFIDTANQYDYILDAVGKRKSSRLKENLKGNLKPNGRYDSIDDELLQMDSQRLASLTDLIEQNHFNIVVDKTFLMEDIKLAHEYVEKGHKVGGVAVKIN